MATVTKDRVKKTPDKQPSVDQREQVQYQPEQEAVRHDAHTNAQSGTSTGEDGSKMSVGVSWDTSQPLSWKPEPMGVGIASWNEGNKDKAADKQRTTSAASADEQESDQDTNSNDRNTAIAPQQRPQPQAPPKTSNASTSSPPASSSSSSPRKTRQKKRRSKDWPKTQNVMEKREYDDADSSKPAMKGGELKMEQKVDLSWDTEKPLSWMS
ncbi:MAG: hypothetical protein M1831_000382 [Alyxoria varia]|nr:MAG: hypothetical protein M1831_000382 [Alyxoria varia]